MSLFRQRKVIYILVETTVEDGGTVKLTGTYKTNRYAVHVNGRRVNGRTHHLIDTGPQPEARQQRINLFDADGLDAKFNGAIVKTVISSKRDN